MKKQDQIRARIATLKAERARIVGLPPARERAADVLERQLLVLAADGRERLQVQLRKLAAGTEPAAALFRARVGSEYGLEHASLGPLLCALLTPAVVMDALAPLLESMPAGISDDDRKARLAAIDAELWAAEIEEERLIVEAEARGEVVQRRGDANPAAVLYMPDPAVLS